MNHVSRWAAPTLLAVSLALTSAAAQAATMLYRDVPGLVEIADVVVVGEIVDAEVFMGRLGHITTRWTVRVDETLAGQPSDQVRFTQWAGQLDGRAESVPGDATFTVGERVVLFLAGDDSDDLFLAALAQSKFSVPAAVAPFEPGGVVGWGPSVFGDLLAPPSLSVAALPANTPVYRDLSSLSLMLQTPAGLTTLEGRLEVDTLASLAAAVRAAQGQP
ncbi:MAG: hypothetical protein H6698_03210 [Myxococcales bacterium]|nr:hypothetical protein [Myxococcales bacterium]